MIRVIQALNAKNFEDKLNEALDDGFAITFFRVVVIGINTTKYVAITDDEAE